MDPTLSGAVAALISAVATAILWWAAATFGPNGTRSRPLKGKHQSPPDSEE